MSVKTEDSVQNLIRLSVNLSPEVFGELKSYANRKGITVTEAVRHAISDLKFVDEAENRLYIEEDGKLHKIIFR
jgi:hypothetical protein